MTTEQTNRSDIPIRIIARLDIKGPDVVKGIQLEGVRRVGIPGEMSKRYYEQGVDEILFIDSVASLYRRNNILDHVTSAAREVFVPLTVGGGLRSVDDIRAALRAGADKVALNTAAIHRPEFISEAANTFGSQCIVVSVQAMQKANGSWEAYTDNAREQTGIDVLEWVVEAQRRGAGEFIITSINREGGKNGFDLDLLDQVYCRVNVPIIAHGGAGTEDHVIQLLEKQRADAFACASIFHYGICTIPKLKKCLSGHGHVTR